MVASNVILAIDLTGTQIAFSSASQTCRADELLKTQGLESTDEDVSTIADGVSDNGSQCQCWHGQCRRSSIPQDGYVRQQLLRHV